GDEIVAVAVVAFDVGGEQQRRLEKEHRGVDDHEQVEHERPMRDLAEAELPPPESSDVEEDPDHPAEMDPGKTLMTRPAQELGDAVQQAGHAQAEQDGDQHPDVEIEIDLDVSYRRIIEPWHRRTFFNCRLSAALPYFAG